MRMHAELDALSSSIREWEKKIEEYKNRKCAVKVAHSLFGRSAAHEGSGSISILLTEYDDKLAVWQALKTKSYFQECLSNYALTLVSSKGFNYCPGEDTTCLLVMKRRNTKQKTDYK